MKLYGFTMHCNSNRDEQDHDEYNSILMNVCDYGDGLIIYHVGPSDNTHFIGCSTKDKNLYDEVDKVLSWARDFVHEATATIHNVEKSWVKE